MPKTVLQTVRFGVSPETLFDIYMDSKKHAAAIAARATLSRKVGGKFTAHNRYITGRNLAIVPKRMIVQSWRGSDWRKPILDSVLILTFTKAPGGARLDLVHANLPDHVYRSIKKGWTTHYWNRWKAYLKRRA